MSKLKGLCNVLLSRLLRSPDWALSDDYLFPNLKDYLDGRKFNSNEEINVQANAYFEILKKYFEDLEEFIYLGEVKKFVKSWTVSSLRSMLCVWSSKKTILGNNYFPLKILCYIQKFTDPLIVSSK